MESTPRSLRSGDVIGLGCDVDAETCAANLTKYVMFRLFYSIPIIDLDVDVNTNNVKKEDNDSDVAEFGNEDNLMLMKQEMREFDEYLKDFEDVPADDFILIGSSDSDKDDSWKKRVSQKTLFIDGKIKKEPLSDAVVISDLDDPMPQSPIKNVLENKNCIDSKIKKEQLSDAVVISDMEDQMPQRSRKKVLKKKSSISRILSSDSEEEELNIPSKNKRRRIISRPVDSDSDDVVLVEESASERKDKKLETQNNELKIQNKEPVAEIKDKKLVLSKNETEIINKDCMVYLSRIKERETSMSPNASDTTSTCNENKKTPSISKKKCSKQDDSLFDPHPSQKVEPLKLKIRNGKFSIKPSPTPKRRHSEAAIKHKQRELLSKTRRNSVANDKPNQINGNVSPKDLKCANLNNKVTEKKPILIAAIPIDKASRKALEATKLSLKGIEAKAKSHTKTPPRQSRFERSRNEVIKNDRKDKLKGLAESSKPDVSKPTMKTQTKPKVKVTNKNRGFFLAGTLPPPPPPQNTKNMPKLVNELKVVTTSNSDKTSQKEIPSRVNNSCDKKRISHASKQNTAEPQPSTSAALTNGYHNGAKNPAQEIENLIDINIQTNAMPMMPKLTVDDLVLPPFYAFSKNHIIKSILAKPGVKRKDKKSVKFNDVLQFRDYKLEAFVDYEYIDFNSILTSVTSWMPEWLDFPNHCVNGVDHTLKRIPLEFKDIDSYHQ